MAKKPIPTLTPPSHHFTPQNLKYKVLYQEINMLLDYLIQKCYEPHVINMRDKLNPLGEGFDSEEFLQLVDGYKYKDLIFKNVNPRTVAVMLPRIYTLKGTKKGLKLLLNLLGIKADIYIWWEIVRNLQRNNKEAQEFRSKFGDIQIRDIENCSIYLNYVDKLGGGGFASLLQGDIDVKLKELVTAFLWVCAFINVINILREFREQFNLLDEFKHTGSYHNLSVTYDSYTWRSGNIKRESDVIYDAKHKYNETDLEYRKSIDNSLIPGYTYTEREQRWISVGSDLNHFEDYTFSGSITLNSAISTDSQEQTHYIRDVVSSNDLLVGSTLTTADMSTSNNVRDSVLVIDEVPVRDSSDASKLLYDPKYLYNSKAPEGISSKTPDGDLAYDKPMSERINLQSTLNFTIEED